MKLSVQTFKLLIVPTDRDILSLVYQQWVCTSIYWPLSYPFRSLDNYPLFRYNTEPVCLGGLANNSNINNESPHKDHNYQNKIIAAEYVPKV